MARSKEGVEYYKIMTRWCDDDYHDTTCDSYAVKFENGKMVDIVDLNTIYAEKYVEGAEMNHKYDSQQFMTPSRRTMFAHMEDILDYKDKSEIVLRKLKGKDLDYILRASSYIATPPINEYRTYVDKYYNSDRVLDKANYAKITEADFEAACQKRDELFRSAIKFKRLRKLKKSEKTESGL